MSANEIALKVGRRVLTISNPDKVLYPGGRFVKAQVIEYYLRAGSFLLPHFKNRPVTLVRYPEGVFGKSFYEKNAPGFTPTWIKSFGVPRREGGTIDYILINDLPTLVWVANLAALELHPFLHRVPKIDTPTHVVFDLDPGEGVDILGAGEVALQIRDLLKQLRLESFPKVSGSKGVQVYVPLNSSVTYEMTSAFARAVADLLSKKYPDRIVSAMAKHLRKGKVFIDWSQNSQTKTTVGPYSLRAKRERPFVSMPLTWEELKKAINRSSPGSIAFEPAAALKRLNRVGDLFLPILQLKQQLPPALTHAVASTPRVKGLDHYSAKRDFSKTTEPRPNLPRRSAQGSRRRFVVQKHAATQLHYDFRLEMQGVLKSWAVPKGMPVRKGERRSAFETEDHPLDYLAFEGTIPQGEYGGGTVMVWDIGTYDLVEGNYYKGEMTVFLAGHKLKGQWIVKRLGEENGDSNKRTWLIIKSKTDAKPISATRAERSVLSKRTMEQISKSPGATWHTDKAG